MDPFEREEAHAQLNRTVANPTAKAAIDMALWDVIGQATGNSVTRLLGGYADRMRVAHMLGFDNPDALVSEAHRIPDTYGITTFKKIKVGRHPITLDVAAYHALREALGPDVELYIDGNRGWTAAEAARALAELDGIGLSFAEELCPTDDVVAAAGLSAIPAFQCSPTRVRRARRRSARAAPPWVRGHCRVLQASIDIPVRHRPEFR